MHIHKCDGKRLARARTGFNQAATLERQREWVEWGGRFSLAHAAFSVLIGCDWARAMAWKGVGSVPDT